MKFVFRVFALLFILILTACGSGSGGGQVAGGGQNSVAARSAPLPPDADCPGGGILVETGIDENGNGLLDTEEVDQSEKVCNGTGSLALLSDEVIGPNCPFGGVRIDTGIDTNGNGVLDAAEITDTKFVCTPASALLEAKEKLLALDAGTGDQFGFSVSISGDYAIVGAFLQDAGGANAGAAYIYRRTGPNTWDAGTKVTAPDAQAGDQFGVSVSISGDYAIVGADLEDARASSAGAAYIYRRTGPNTWDAGTKITAPDAQASDVFGRSVSISGDGAIVGALFEDAGGSAAGAAYIYQRTGPNAWDAGTKITAPDAQAGDQFGVSVSISGDGAIVGAFLEDVGGASAGAAYIYQRTGPNTWDAGIKITAPDAQADDRFGTSASISGNTAIVGADREDAGGASAGAAYIYQRTGPNTWDAGIKITASDAQAGDQFGVSVSISGDTALVGARSEDAGGASAGAAYIYQRTEPNTWDAGTKVTAPDAQAGDLFGFSVSISGNTAIVGARFEDAGGVNAGAAYIVR